MPSSGSSGSGHPILTVTQLFWGSKCPACSASSLFLLSYPRMPPSTWVGSSSFPRPPLLVTLKRCFSVAFFPSSLFLFCYARGGHTVLFGSSYLPVFEGPPPPPPPHHPKRKQADSKADILSPGLQDNILVSLILHCKLHLLKTVFDFTWDKASLCTLDGRKLTL